MALPVAGGGTARWLKTCAIADRSHDEPNLQVLAACARRHTDTGLMGTRGATKAELDRNRRFPCIPPGGAPAGPAPRVSMHKRARPPGSLRRSAKQAIALRENRWSTGVELRLSRIDRRTFRTAPFGTSWSGRRRVADADLIRAIAYPGLPAVRSAYIESSPIPGPRLRCPPDAFSASKPIPTLWAARRPT